MSADANTSLQQRLVIGFGLAALAILAIYVSVDPIWKWGFFLFIALVINAGLWEYYRLVKDKGFRPMVIGGLLVAVAYLLATFMATQDNSISGLPRAVLAFGSISLCLYYFVRGDNPLLNLATTLFGIFYLVIPAGFLFLIGYGFPPQAPFEGRFWVCFLIVITKMTDTGAYFVGSRWGKTKLAPFLSPNKTIEGAFGGTLTAIGTGLLFWAIAALFPSVTTSHLSFWDAILLGVALSIMAQMGDLTESLFKRDAGIKHSNSLPGVGGFLDVLDSLIFTTPTLYFFLTWRQFISSCP